MALPLSSALSAEQDQKLATKIAKPHGQLPTCVRISRGTYPKSQYTEMKELMRKAGETLIPEILKLEGCLHYYAGIDEDARSLINVSIWRSEESARKMSEMQAMKRLGQEFVKLGVEFERPIINYETLWVVGD